MSRVLEGVARTTRPLSEISRFSRDFCFRRESVLEHTGFVVLYCLAMGRRLQEAGAEVDMEKLLVLAAIHDADEAITGDINRSAKYSSDSALEALEVFARQGALSATQPFGAGAFELWEQGKGAGLEGEVLRVADLASVVEKVDVELKSLGNGAFRRVADECLEYVHATMKQVSEPLLLEELRGLAVKIKGQRPISGAPL